MRVRDMTGKMCTFAGKLTVKGKKRKNKELWQKLLTSAS